MSVLKMRQVPASIRNRKREKGLSQGARRRMLFEPLEGRQMMHGGATPDWTSSIPDVYPDLTVQASKLNYLSGATQGDKVGVALNYLKSHAAEFGVAANDFNYAIISNNYTSSNNGITHIYLQQSANGLPIEGALAYANVMADGRVLTAGSSFLPGLSSGQSTRPVPGLSAAQAIANFSTQSAYGNESTNISVTTDANSWSGNAVIKSGPNQRLTINASLHLVPNGHGGADLAWHLSPIYTLDGDHAYDISVGADPAKAGYGRVIRVTDWAESASYNVIPATAESPADSPQTVIINPADPTASPFGWHDSNGAPTGGEFTDTRGNNVSAQEDADDNDTGGARPSGGAGLNFNFPFNPAAAPTAYTDLATTNLFYMTNVMHDVFYLYGFNEASGNFQVTNFTGQGLGGDPLIADSQDGSGTDNANMATPPDGQSPRMQQYIFTATSPNRDSDLENAIIMHEFTHGISNRLTGGPANANALDAQQSGGMGEGWGDFVGLWMTQKATDVAATPRPIGNYVLGQTAAGGGIRRNPYSVDLAMDPLTLGDYNGGFPNNEVHNSGEIWASVLWDMNWSLINKYGYDPDIYRGTGGNNIAMQLVIDGMKLQPANPTFLDARDAILAADLANNGGANFDAIWATFARRGFGFSASAGVDADSDVVVEAFDVPPVKTISGVVYADANGNGSRQNGEVGLGGFTIFLDRDNDAVLDSNELSTVSAADGTYSINTLQTGSVVVRQVLNNDFTQTQPTNNGGYAITLTSTPATFAGRNFGDQEKPGEIRGFKWKDMDRDGIQDPGETGFGGVMIYVDLNNDGKINVLEPAAVTDQFGNYRITNVPAGTYTMREVAAPGMASTFPLATATHAAGVQEGVVVVRNQITYAVNFGNVPIFDYGDAPASYGTLAADNGPVHAILTGFGLGGPVGSIVEADDNGQPSANADADRFDNGITFNIFTPGAPAVITARATTGGRAAAYLQGWIDFDGNGKFDSTEQIVKDFRLRGDYVPVTLPSFVVPTTTPLGNVYARFRYSYELGLGPTGPAMIGEVEDYVVGVVDTKPVAVDDLSGGQPIVTIKQTTTPAPVAIDVLANDIGSSADSGAKPKLYVGGFDTASAQGGTVALSNDGLKLIYTPPADFIGIDTFTYMVQDSTGNVSSTRATVTINITPGEPIVNDDTFNVPTGSVAFPLPVLDNDLPSTGLTITDIQTQPGFSGTLIQDPSNNRRLLYTPAAGFTGTVQFSYSVNDTDPTTLDNGRATVTLQVFPTGTTPTPPYLASLRLAIFQNGVELAPNAAVAAGSTVEVRAYSNDLRSALSGPEELSHRGVEAAYLDVLFDSTKVEKILPADIVHSAAYSLDKSGSPNRPGVINEVGGVHDSLSDGFTNGTDDVLVFTVQVTIRSNATGTLKFTADPAEDSAALPGRTQIILADSETDVDQTPEVVNDAQVLLISSPTITIGSAFAATSEGEYTNSSNALDVNSDGNVTALDALIVINEINANGSRDLNELTLALTGQLPPGYYIDVTRDGAVAPIDVLAVINWLNANPIQPSDLTASNGTESEGEATESVTSARVASTPAGLSDATTVTASPAVAASTSSAYFLAASERDKASNNSTIASGPVEQAANLYSAFQLPAVDFVMTESDLVTGNSEGGEDREELYLDSIFTDAALADLFA